MSLNFSKTHTIAILFNYRQNKCSNFEWATILRKKKNLWMSFLKQIRNTKNNLWPCADLYFSTELITSIRYTNSVETWTKQASDEMLNHYENYYASHHSN